MWLKVVLCGKYMNTSWHNIIMVRVVFHVFLHAYVYISTLRTHRKQTDKQINRQTNKVIAINLLCKINNSSEQRNYVFDFNGGGGGMLPSTGMCQGEVFAISDCLVIYSLQIKLNVTKCVLHCTRYSLSDVIYVTW